MKLNPGGLWDHPGDGFHVVHHRGQRWQNWRIGTGGLSCLGSVKVDCVVVSDDVISRAASFILWHAASSGVGGTLGSCDLCVCLVTGWLWKKNRKRKAQAQLSPAGILAAKLRNMATPPFQSDFDVSLKTHPNENGGFGGLNVFLWHFAVMGDTFERLSA